MNRGDVVVVRMAATPAATARPCVIVQRDGTLDIATKLTLCPLTSGLRGSRSQRPFVAPSFDNGLKVPSEVEIDRIFTGPVSCLGPRLGTLDAAVMRHVDLALLRWLGL